MVRTFGQKPVLLDKASENPVPTPAKPEPAPAAEKLAPANVRLKPSRLGALAMWSTALAALFWVGVSGAFLVGWLGLAGLLALDPVRASLFAACALVPPLLFLAIGALVARSAAMGDATRALLAASDRLFAADETVANNAARLTRHVRRELDGLNTGLEAASQRMRALEQILESQIATLDEAGARAQVRGETIAARLNLESQRIETLGDSLTEAAGRAGETIAGRAAQLKATMESAEGTLKMATQSLDVQAAGFRAAITQASEAPHEAAQELDRQAARIEEVSASAMQRAEFVLARQEKTRAGLGDVLTKLQEQGDALETALTQQRRSLEQAAEALRGEAESFGAITGKSEQQLEALMMGAATRAQQLTTAFTREAERLRDTGDAASAVLATLSAALKEAGLGAQTLIGESANQAKHDARLLVGEAMAECERLLRTAGEMSAEAGRIRGTITKTTEELERHLIRLPALAQEEARRVRQLMASETDQMLDISARAMATLHARSGQKGAVPAIVEQPRAAEPEPEGLKGLARKLTARPRRPDGKGWEMKTLLAAADEGEDMRARSGASGNAAALGALQAALSDMALDLSALDNSRPGNEEWKQYLQGDRSVFARRLADTIDEDAVNRITTLYREDTRFHDAADAYLAEFETLLTRAKESDGGGLLTSTLLSADTGKVYLAIAYALGRL